VKLNKGDAVIILLDGADLDDCPYPTDNAPEKAAEYGE
jgi:hypothetical protein